jgi:hypothetical protein
MRFGLNSVPSPFFKEFRIFVFSHSSTHICLASSQLLMLILVLTTCKHYNSMGPFDAAPVS